VTCAVSKCESHLAEQTRARDSRQVYESMSALVDGVPQNRRLIEELLEPLESMDFAWPWPDTRNRVALELGCGIGLYVPWLLASGFIYVGVEPDPWAREFCAMNHRVQVIEKKFEDLAAVGVGADLVLAAHVLEHLPHAPVALEKIHDSYLSPGGMLILLIPDDTDLWNPDHYWFFNTETLRATLERIGFRDVRMAVRKRIPRENFIYATARKA
jgi:SAM-dependent methyltransferase